MGGTQARRRARGEGVEARAGSGGGACVVCVQRVGLEGGPEADCARVGVRACVRACGLRLCECACVVSE